DALAYDPQKTVVIPVNSQIIVAVIDDDQVAVAAHPVRKYNFAGRDRDDILAAARADEQAAPARPALRALGAKTAHQFAPHRKSHLSPQGRKISLAGPGSGPAPHFSE